MKLRNQLLALCCLLAFAAAGWLYVREWVVQKPFGIILFVSDGMISRHLTAARLYENGASHRLALEAFPHLALVRNAAGDFAVPDDSAAATALATGATVNHRTLSQDARGRQLKTILDLARRQGRAVGLVSTGDLAAPAAAAFYAHAADTRDRPALAAQLLGAEKLDVVLGGGAGDFLPTEKGGRRADGRDLLAELKAQGWELVRSKAELASAPAYRTASLAGFFSNDPLAFSDQIESGSQQPSLADMVGRAIQFLQVRSAGYVLIVDASLATTAAERNEGERVLTETLALDRAVKTAADYAGEKSLIIAVGKHATGGLNLNGYPLVTDHGVGLLGVNASGQPALTWATGPNGPAPVPSPAAKSEPSAFLTPSAMNTAEDVVALGSGDGAEKLHGFLNLTDIFHILREAL
ncbi:MAG: alkaline phosphatase [Chthoniobacter sp.]|nr:alkaline phosphatase [Chthoniobacter sp.]